MLGPNAQTGLIIAYVSLALWAVAAVALAPSAGRYLRYLASAVVWMKAQLLGQGRALLSQRFRPASYYRNEPISQALAAVL